MRGPPNFFANLSILTPTHNKQISALQIRGFTIACHSLSLGNHPLRRLVGAINPVRLPTINVTEFT